MIVLAVSVGLGVELAEDKTVEDMMICVELIAADGAVDVGTETIEL